MKLSSIIGKFEGAENMVSHNNGYSKVPNQYIIYGSKGRAFQSYNTIIAAVSNGNVYLTKDYNCSTTTSKYCNQFLGMTSKERDAKIKSGEIKIVELSK